jgi:TRAP transporter 4TM/12TM fusion protein
VARTSNVILRAATVDDGPKDLSDRQILRSRMNDSVAQDGVVLQRPLGRSSRAAVFALALALGGWGILAAVAVVPAHKVRVVHVALLLPLAFLLQPAHPRWRRLNAVDVGLAVLSAVSLGYVLLDFDAFLDRSSRPSVLDQTFGVLTILLVLEAGRRTAGVVLPALALLGLVYAFAGAWLPAPWTHRGYGLGRLVGLEYMGLEGLFGTPVAVSATFIVLFTLYGALLDASGAGRFFVEFAFAALGRRRSGAGRTVTLASFLLGGPSGSGVATAVTLGSVAYPVLREAGYDREHAGAILAAGGIGAVLSPPVMGAASFLIAELTQVSYLEVLRWALVPTLLYYLAVFLTIEVDAARLGTREVALPPRSLGGLLRQGWAHFLSLVAIVVLLAVGRSAERAVLWAMALAVAASALRPETRLTPRAILGAIERGARAMVPVGVTCAAAGLLVGVVNLTGLGLKLSGILVDMGGGLLFPTLLLTALVLLVLGLALPITASYVVAAVVTAPALEHLGVPLPAAHMFIFFYAVLSEVSPPTALSCVAVSAITGGDVYRTMWITWRYALPAFVVPFLFALPGGTALLLLGPWPDVVRATATAMLGMVALVAGAAGYLGGRLPVASRAFGVAAGVLLSHTALWADGAGLLLLAMAWLTRRGARIIRP